MAMREEPLAIVLSVAINKNKEIGIAETAPFKGHRDIVGSLNMFPIAFVRESRISNMHNVST